MVQKKKPAARKPKKRRSKGRGGFGSGLKKMLAAIALLLIAVAATGVLLHYLISDRKPVKAPTPVPPQGRTSALKPAFEVFPQKDMPVRKPPTPPAVKPTPAPDRPKVAIIIDDLGYDLQIAREFMNLDAILTFSILPIVPFHRQIADAAYAKGFEAMLHLPMEPVEYPQVNPGEGALLSAMTPDELIAQLHNDLEAIPHARGVNNHMGSRMTTNSTQLYQIFTILKKRGLYFIDSRTTAETVCRPSARLFQLSFAQRDVFLDNVQQTDAVRRQLNQLLQIAESHGEAVGIAHPYAVTVDVLRDMLPEILEKVELVPASAVVHSAG